jgi:dihydropteroate synthase
LAYRCRLPSIGGVEDFKSMVCARGIPPHEAERCLEEMYVTSVVVEEVEKGLAREVARTFAARGGFGRVLESEGSRGDSADLLLSGTLRHFRELCEASGGLMPGDCRAGVYREVRRVLETIEGSPPPPVHYKHKKLEFSRKVHVMGVLNVTPDSFYDGGAYLDPSAAVEHALRMEQCGADIIDVGGESTRPGSDPVPPDVQRERVVPVIEGIRRNSDIWISVDTYSSEVARAAIEAGADMINDISGGRFDPEMPALAAEKGTPIIAMHIRGTPKDMQVAPRYRSLIPDLVEYFETCLERLVEAGVAREKVLIDPGIGFGKTVEHNLLILKGLGELKVLRRPIVLGVSRKSFIGTILGRDADERLWGTVAATVIGGWNGAHVVRVHDVAEVRDAVEMVRAVREVRYV